MVAILTVLLACQPEPAGACDDPAACDTAPAGDDETGETGAVDTAGDTAEDTGEDTSAPVDADGDGFPVADDCDDLDPAVHPGAAETCDGRDENCDGEVDEGFGTLAYLSDGPTEGGPYTGGDWYGYDEDGHAVFLGVDDDANGVMEAWTRWEWTGGLMTAESASSDGAALSRRYEYDYDAEEHIIEGRLDYEGDGVWNYDYGYEYQDGVYVGYWWDDGADGLGVGYSRYEIDAEGHYVHYESDNEGDGRIDVEAWYTWVDGHNTYTEADNDGDGVFETVAVYTWEGDRILDEEVAGGPYPYRRTYAHTDADDHWDRSDYDAGSDGSIDYRYTQTHTGDVLTGQTTDAGADGVEVYSYAYEVDGEGRNTGVVTKLDGVLVSEAEYTYDTDGNVASYRVDGNGDGTWDNEYAFDAWGHQTYGYTLGDGVSTGVERVWTDDGRGRLLGSTIDNGADGVLEYEQVALEGYACGVR